MVEHEAIARSLVGVLGMRKQALERPHHQVTQYWIRLK
jgi:hypothetical protein